MRGFEDAENYEWYYRVIGTTAAGSVSTTMVVAGCENPPTKADMERLESTHEQVLAHAGTRMASTVGPMPKRRKT